MKCFIVAILTLCLLPVSGFCYGPRGHALVGAIADLRLTTNKEALRPELRNFSMA